MIRIELHFKDQHIKTFNTKFYDIYGNFLIVHTGLDESGCSLGNTKDYVFSLDEIVEINKRSI